MTHPADRCSRCGAPLTAPVELCPACLLAAGLEPLPDTQAETGSMLRLTTIDPARGGVRIRFTDWPGPARAASMAGSRRVD